MAIVSSEMVNMSNVFDETESYKEAEYECAGLPKNLDKDLFWNEQHAFECAFNDTDTEKTNFKIYDTSSVATAPNAKNLEARVQYLEDSCRVLEEKVGQIVQVLARKKINKERQSKAVKHCDLEKFMKEAILHGTGEFGVSKPYIRKYLNDKCNITDTR